MYRIGGRGIRLTKGTGERSFNIRLLHRAECLTELEDARTNRVLVKGGGSPVSRGRGRGSDRWLRSRSIDLGRRSSQLELQLGLGSTDESLEDSRVGLVENDIAGSRVGIALEEHSLVRGDAEKVAEL